MYRIKKMNKSWFPLIILLIIGCSENKKEVSTDPDQSLKKPVKLKFYGHSDRPKNDSMITSIGAGKVILGENLDQIDQLYDSVQNITVYLDGIEWPGKKVFLNSDEWIIASSNNSIKQITGIRTNSKLFRSKNGNKIGLLLRELHVYDSLGIDKEERALILYRDGIELKMDKSSEDDFFHNKTPDISRLNKSAIIKEFLVKCGDC
jgi:hypothetical protein